MIKPEITEQFFETILGEDWRNEVLILQCYDDNKDRLLSDSAAAKGANKIYRSPRSATLIGKWEQVRRQAETLANDGCCIAWAVQRFEGKRRDDPAFFREIRVLAPDFDEVKALPEFPLIPHAVVESSPGKFHVYWRVESLVREAFSRLMIVLIEKYGADANAKDVCRVLRLPGFPNQKIDSRKGFIASVNGTSPHIVRLISWHDDPPYSEEELLLAFEVERFELEKKQVLKAPPTKTFSRIIPSSVPQNMHEISAALAFISADSRHTWLTIGMALASMGGMEARSLWDTWSKKSPKFDQLDQDLRWDSFRENKERVPDESLRVGIGTLFHMARLGGYDGRKKKDENWRSLLTLGGEKGDKHPTESLNNFIMFFKNHEEWAGKLWWNSVSSIPMLGDISYSDRLCGDIAEWMGREERISVRSPGLIEKAFRAVCQASPRDLIQEWLAAVPSWDGEPRLTEWFSDLAGAPKSAYGMDVSRLIFVSLVARGLCPGCRYRWVVIMEGPEETGKTSLLQAIGGPWYGTLSVNLDSKEAHMMLKGAWLAELSELDSLRKSDEARIKSFISDTHDIFIPKYSNDRISVPRRTVFFGTTNEHRYLKGESGNTRFLPIATETGIQWKLLEGIRVQLFAEAKVFYAEHPEDWWALSEEGTTEAVEVRKTRRIENPYEEGLSAFLDVRQETYWTEIARDFLGMRDKKEWADKSIQMQIASALKAMGWEQKKRVWREGNQVSLWTKTTDG